MTGGDKGGPRGGDPAWPLPMDSFGSAALPALLVAGASGPSDEWSALAGQMGVRLAGTLTWPELAARPDALNGIEIIYADCRDTAQGLVQLREMAGAGRLLRLIVLASLDTLDAADSCLDPNLDQLLCAPEPRDIALALWQARESAVGRNTVRSGDGYGHGGDRLEHIAGELRELRAAIEILARQGGTGLGGGLGPASLRAPGRGFAAQPALDGLPTGSQLTAQRVRALLRARRIRERLLPADLFADPAWDIMLDLLASELEGGRVSVSSLCIAACVPPTTALRWIRQMSEQGLLRRTADEEDGRRIFISLSPETRGALETWFGEAGQWLSAAAAPGA